MPSSSNQFGFFTMDMVREVAAASDLQFAKNLAIKAIEAAEGARPANVAKANTMVRSARSTQNLAISMSNFLLAHDGLAVLKAA